MKKVLSIPSLDNNEQIRKALINRLVKACEEAPVAIIHQLVSSIEAFNQIEDEIEEE